MIPEKEAEKFKQRMDEVLVGFDNNTDLRKLYNEIIINKNFEALRLKSRRQLKQLHGLYFGMARLLLFLARERVQKLREFELFTESLIPIRSDVNDYDEFLSPEKTGKVSSFGPHDPTVQAQKYVYASFDQITHSMSMNRPIKIDQNGLDDKAQIVMLDIAETFVRNQINPDQVLAAYLNNVFSYKLGKKIIAAYLALIFDNAEEAVKFLKNNNTRNIAQRWEERAVDIFKHYSERDFSEKYKLVLARMKDLLDKFGIEPPLALEVRILYSAKSDGLLHPKKK